MYMCNIYIYIYIYICICIYIYITRSLKARSPSQVRAVAARLPRECAAFARGQMGIDWVLSMCIINVSLSLSIYIYIYIYLFFDLKYYVVNNYILILFLSSITH